MSNSSAVHSCEPDVIAFRKNLIRKHAVEAYRKIREVIKQDQHDDPSLEQHLAFDFFGCPVQIKTTVREYARMLSFDAHVDPPEDHKTMLWGPSPDGKAVDKLKGWASQLESNMIQIVRTAIMSPQLQRCLFLTYTDTFSRSFKTLFKRDEKKCNKKHKKCLALVFKALSTSLIEHCSENVVEFSHALRGGPLLAHAKPNTAPRSMNSSLISTQQYIDSLSLSRAELVAQGWILPLTSCIIQPQYPLTRMLFKSLDRVMVAVYAAVGVDVVLTDVIDSLKDSNPLLFRRMETFAKLSVAFHQSALSTVLEYMGKMVHSLSAPAKPEFYTRILQASIEASTKEMSTATFMKKDADNLTPDEMKELFGNLDDKQRGDAQPKKRSDGRERRVGKKKAAGNAYRAGGATELFSNTVTKQCGVELVSISQDGDEEYPLSDNINSSPLGSWAALPRTATRQQRAAALQPFKKTLRVLFVSSPDEEKNKALRFRRVNVAMAIFIGRNRHGCSGVPQDL